MNRGRSKISGLAIAELRRTGLFWHAFLIPLINTYLRLFSEYEQQTLYNTHFRAEPFLPDIHRSPRWRCWWRQICLHLAESDQFFSHAL